MYSLWSTVQTGSVRLGTKEHTESHAASMLAADIACTTLKAHSLRLLAGQARVVIVHRWLLSVQHHGHQQTFSEGSTKKYRMSRSADMRLRGPTRSRRDRHASSAVAGDDGGSDVCSESCHITSL